MCYETRDQVIARICKERDELRRICEKQIRMNRVTAQNALNMDTLIGINETLNCRITELEEDLECARQDLLNKETELESMEEVFAQETKKLKAELAIVKSDRDRLERLYKSC